jgi:tetratricopeptide (TPR) repeat protein
MSATEEPKKVNEPIVADESSAAANSMNIKKVRSLTTWIGGGLVVVILIALGYYYGYRQPAINSGNEAIGEADRIALFENNDSTSLEAYEAVAAEYGFDAGNRAKLQSAILLYKQGEYEKALSYLNDYDVTDHLIGATATALKGDCLVNLDKLDEAVKAFDKAISISDENPVLIPYLLNKKAVVLEAQQNYAAAAEIYKKIEDEYPAYAAQTRAEGHRLQNEALAGK